MPTPVIAAPIVEPPHTTGAPIDTRPLDPVAAGTLRLRTPDPAGRSFMTAVSGLAAAGGAAWVVSDEYGKLGRFDRISEPGQLLPGLPAQKTKPDLEAILHVPSAGSAPAMVFAVGSGSTKQRNRGTVQDIDASGAALGAPRTIDLAPLYAELDRRLPMQPNIEGIALHDGAAGPELLVFHRGKLDGDVNTIFRIDAPRAITALRTGSAIPVDALRGSVELDLGRLGGARLGFADAIALGDGRIAFIAGSEGNDATGDGEIYGSVLGVLDRDLAVTTLRPMTGPARKVEGVELANRLDPAASPTSFVLVTDPDDPTRGTEVLTVDLG